MSEPATIWDQIASEQARMRSIASSVRTQKRDLNYLPQDQLVEIFKAICIAGSEFDPKLKFRRRILRLLEDQSLIDLVGVQMPVLLIHMIESRLRSRGDN